MKKLVVCFLAASVALLGQSTHNGNLSVLGNFDVTQGSSNTSRPMTTVMTDPSGLCPNAAAMVLNVSSSPNAGHISSCVAGTWTLSGGGGSGGFSNPMTTQGDLIYGGASGAATRLAAGTANYVLTSNGPGTAPAWTANTPGSVTINGTTGTNFTLPLLGAGAGIATPYNSGTNTTTISYTVSGRTVSTGTTDSITNSDCDNTINYNDASNVTATIANVGTIAVGCQITVVNRGSGQVTLSNGGGSSTINGAASLILPGGTATAPTNVEFYADATNNYTIQNISTSGGGGGGSSSITQGTYAARPTTCGAGALYVYNNGGAQTFSLCGTGNAWSTFYHGSAITPAAEIGAIASNTWNRTTGVTVATTFGPEVMTVTADNTGSGNTSERYWSAPAAPYTKNLRFALPPLIDGANYRDWEIGFQDSTGARIGLTCGVGVGITTGFWCEVIPYSSSNVAGTAVMAISNLAQWGQNLNGKEVQILLGDDGTNISWQICGGPGACTPIYSQGRTVSTAAPTRLYYGLANTAASGTIQMAFIGSN